MGLAHCSHAARQGRTTHLSQFLSALEHLESGVLHVLHALVVEPQQLLGLLHVAAQLAPLKLFRPHFQLGRHLQSRQMCAVSD